MVDSSRRDSNTSTRNWRRQYWDANSAPMFGDQQRFSYLRKVMNCDPTRRYLYGFGVYRRHRCTQLVVAILNNSVVQRNVIDCCVRG